MLNTDYAILINGYPQYARMPITLENDIVTNGVTHKAGSIFSTNNPEVLVQLGYKKIVKTAMPQKEGFYYTETWSEAENKIVQGWIEHEEPEDTVADMVEGYNILGYSEDIANG